MVALVGGGGKTSAVGLLAGELASRGRRVLVATTTAMFLREMTAVGPVVHGRRRDCADRRTEEGLGEGTDGFGGAMPRSPAARWPVCLRLRSTRCGPRVWSTT